MSQRPARRIADQKHSMGNAYKAFFSTPPSGPHGRLVSRRGYRSAPAQRVAPRPGGRVASQSQTTARGRAPKAANNDMISDFRCCSRPRILRTLAATMMCGDVVLGCGAHRRCTRCTPKSGVSVSGQNWGGPCSGLREPSLLSFPFSLSQFPSSQLWLLTDATSKARAIQNLI